MSVFDPVLSLAPKSALGQLLAEARPLRSAVAQTSSKAMRWPRSTTDGRAGDPVLQGRLALVSADRILVLPQIA